MCVRHHVLVYHYCLATRPCERFTRFVNNPHYMFATVDITNDVKALKNSGIACQNLVDIQGQYKIYGSKEHEKDSLVHLAEAIIDPYYREMKDSCNKDKRAWCRCQNRRISGRGSRTVRLRLMVTGDWGRDVYLGSGPLDGGNTLLPA